MTLKIKIWSSKNLSFSGRLQLINFVLMSIHTYWAQVFILPTKVLKKINEICRSYLWIGLHNSSKPGYVNWDKFCSPKKSGGLGVRYVVLWNKAALGKQVWNIAQKTDNLWVTWVHSVYIKSKAWDTYRTPTCASWVWKIMVQTKDEISHALHNSSWLTAAKNL